MKISKIASIPSPRLPKQLSAKIIQALESNSEYSSIICSGCNLAGQKAENVLLEQAHFRRVIFNETNIKKLRWFDARIEKSDFTSAKWEQARFQRVEFVGCRFLGIQLLEAEIENTVFTECIFDNAMLISADISSVRFEKCNLQNISIESTKLSETGFHNCDLTHAIFGRTKLSGTDLRGSILNGMQIDAQEMQGAIIDPSQALQVVGLLGVIIRENDDPSIE
jgi:uncharacterized protein YjbI with pentapeptide repeats